MADPTSFSPTPLNLLIREIEATPKTYWADLLGILRQFRQKVVPISPITDPEQARKNQAAVDLLDSWLSDDEDEVEHRQAWDFLKTALDQLEGEPGDGVGFA